MKNEAHLPKLDDSSLRTLRTSLEEEEEAHLNSSPSSLNS